MSRKNYHDLFARLHLSNPDIARGFLEHFVDDPWVGAVDLSRLHSVKNDFINRQLNESITDILLTAPYHNHDAALCFLVEHKSSGTARASKQNLPLQVRKQELFILETFAANHEQGNMPVVHLIALHHGERPYSGPRTVAEKMDAPPELIPARWKDNCIIIDLCHYDDERLASLDAKLSVFMSVLKHIYDEDILAAMQRLLPQLQSLEVVDQDFLISVFRYIYEASRLKNKQQIEQFALKSLSDETGDTVMSIAEQLRKEERTATSRMIAQNLISKGFKLEDVAECTGLSLDEVQAIAKKKKAS